MTKTIVFTMVMVKPNNSNFYKPAVLPVIQPTVHIQDAKNEIIKMK